MVNSKNEHVFPKEGGWIVRREGSKKTSELFKNKKEAIEYASIIALSGGGSVVTHKYNGQFKEFKHGDEVRIRTHKVAPIITGTLEIGYPIVSNTGPVIQKINLV